MKKLADGSTLHHGGVVQPGDDDEPRALATLPPLPQQSLQNILADAMRDPSVDVAKLQAVAAAAGPLLDAQDRVIRRDAEIAFNAAFFRLSRKLPRIPKNGIVLYKDKNGTESKAFNFAKWDDIDDFIRPILDEEGFGLTFESAERPTGGMLITGHLLHEQGHVRSASIPLPIDTSGGKNNLQGAGSSMAYGKRYCTTMLLNLIFIGQDDDGVRAGAISPKEKAELVDLIKETATDTKKFLAFMAVPTLDEIQAKDFAKGRDNLLRKREQQKAAEGGGE